jgi:hypothetical protein
MVCYARPAGRMAVVVLVVLLVFGRHAGHFFDGAALTVAITVAVGGAPVAAAVAFAVFLSVRRRRAAAGGCVSCQFRCQHAMTERPGRLPVVSMVERVPVAPRWPDRPAYRSAAAGRPGGHVEQRERAGSAVLPDLVIAGAGLVRRLGRRPAAVHGAGPRTKRR